MKMPFLLIPLFLFMVGCGNEKKETITPAAPQKVVNELKVDRNSYLAELIPLNSLASGPVSGNANFKIQKETLYAYVRLFNSINGLVHEQRYYEAKACPGLEQDTNADGYIDIVEANSFLGEPIFPLDADISSEEAGFNIFPSIDSSGAYWYEQKVSYEALRSELNLTEKNPDSSFAKLTNGRDLNLSSGVILILGAPSWSNLPETVASSGGFANFQTLPIACGTLRQIYVVPGEIKNDEGVLVPNGPVGGSHGEYDNVPVIFPLPKDAKDYGDDENSFP
jgi:hypothetical protein